METEIEIEIEIELETETEIDKNKLELRLLSLWGSNTLNFNIGSVWPPYDLIDGFYFCIFWRFMSDNYWSQMGQLSPFGLRV